MKHIVVVSIECGADTWEQAVKVVQTRLDGMTHIIHSPTSVVIYQGPAEEPATSVVNTNEYEVVHLDKVDEDAQQRLYLHLRQEADMKDLVEKDVTDNGVDGQETSCANSGHVIDVLENGYPVCVKCGAGLDSIMHKK